ncbi:MAG: DUF115 domain-containing protein [Treponema sp.]|nr:DUF115 domain-containing protein [Treponema sp.]
MNKIRYKFEKSKTGEIVPLIVSSSGAEAQAVHSLVDPKREAQRLISAVTEETGFLIFFGLGGGFYPEAALELTDAQIIVIDFDRKSIEELLISKDYSHLLKNSRFNLLVDFSYEEIKSFITENYKPALHNGIKTIPLRVRVEQDKAVFEKTIDGIQEVIEIVSGDYSVQSHFGIRWFSNIIRNVKNIDKNKNQWQLPVNTEEAAIVAAGPSLDQQLPLIKKAKAQNVFIISSDTAFGVLMQNGIKPDVIISIDCQLISYYHFLGDYSSQLREIPLLLDITSPPMLFGLSNLPLFFSSTHPLSHYICNNFKSMTQLDTSGGNVTYTCLSFAEILGAHNITFYGADFSYIGSRSYAKGTYLNPFFSKKQNRLSPIEAQMSVFLYRSSFLPLENEKKENYFETYQLRFYRKKLEEKIAVMTAKNNNLNIKFAEGKGAPVSIYKSFNNKLNNNQNTIPNIQNTKNITGMDFLEQYRNDIRNLPVISFSCASLNEKQKNIFTTLLPLAAAVKKRNTNLKQNELMEEVKNLSVSKIEKVLNS